MKDYNLTRFFFITAFASGAELAVTYPLVASIVIMQTKKFGLSRAFIKQYQQGLFTGFKPALSAKLLARFSELALGDGIVGNSKDFSSIIAGAVTAAVVEAFATNYHITKSRLLVASKEDLQVLYLRRAALHAVPPHAIKNCCLYIPMFSITRYGGSYLKENHQTSERVSKPLLAAMTSMLMQPVTTLADNWMTVKMLRTYRGRNIQPKYIFKDLLAMSWKQNVRILSARALLSGLSYGIYYASKDICEKIHQSMTP